MPKQPQTEVVPARNDPSPLEPYARSRALELQGQDPDFHYEWFRPDQLAVKLASHEIGNQFSGYLMVDAWEVVDKGQGVTQGRARDDAGKATDTTVTNGELILCRTPLANYAKYGVIERKNDEMVDKRLTGGESHKFRDGSAGTSFKMRTAGGRDGLEANPSDIVRGL